MKFITLSFLAAGLVAQSQQPWNNILAPNRATDWTIAGVQGYPPGSLPSDSWAQCQTSACQAVTNAGASATYDQINTAVTTAPANTYVLLQPGTYNLSSGFCFNGVNNVELRGSGANQTIINPPASLPACMHNAAASTIVGFEASDSTYPTGVGTNVATWSAASSSGASVVFPNGLGSLGSSIVPGKTMIFLDQCNTGLSGATNSSGTCQSGMAVDNGQLWNCGDFGQQTSSSPTGFVGCGLQGEDESFARPHRFHVEANTILSCSPNCTSSGQVTITLADPLINSDWSDTQNPEAWIIQPVSNVGVRGMRLNSTGISPLEVVGFYNATNVWADDLYINNGYELGIWLQDVTHYSVINNYLWNVGQNITCDSNNCDPWGIKDSLSAHGLIQNNIIAGTRVCIATGEGPSMATVVGYNTCLNLTTGSDDMWEGILKHANGDSFILDEGNISPVTTEDADHGNHTINTDFRDLYTAFEGCGNVNCGSYTSKDANLNAIVIEAFNRYHNSVGNVLGTPGITTGQYEFSGYGPQYTYPGPATQAGGYYNNIYTPWSIGAGNGADGTFIPNDSMTFSSFMRWGNWDTFNSATLYCSAASGNCPEDERAYNIPCPQGSNCLAGLSNPSTTLPASFYLASKPAWFGSVPFPPIGPDVTNGNLGVCGGTRDASGQYAFYPATNANQCAGQGLNSAWSGHASATPSYSCYLQLGGVPDGSQPLAQYDVSLCSGSSSPAQAQAPTFSQPSGQYASGTVITLTTQTTGCSGDIFADTNNPPTTNTSSFTLTIAETVNAYIHNCSGFTDSNIVSESFTITPQNNNPTPPAPILNSVTYDGVNLNVNFSPQGASLSTPVFPLIQMCMGGNSCTSTAQSALNAMWNEPANPCLVVPQTGQPITCAPWSYITTYQSNSNAWIWSCPSTVFQGTTFCSAFTSNNPTVFSFAASQGSLWNIAAEQVYTSRNGTNTSSCQSGVFCGGGNVSALSNLITIHATKSAPVVTDVQHASVNGGVICQPQCPAQAVSATSAGDTLVLAIGGTSAGNIQIASVACAPVSCPAWAHPAVALFDPNAGGVDGAYLLNSPTGITSVQITMTNSSPWPIDQDFREYSILGGAISFDKSKTADLPSCTVCVIPSMALAGTDLVIAAASPQNGNMTMNTPFGLVDVGNSEGAIFGESVLSSSASATINQNKAGTEATFMLAFQVQ